MHCPTAFQVGSDPLKNACAVERFDKSDPIAFQAGIKNGGTNCMRRIERMLEHCPPGSKLAA